ncbi:MAG: DUF1549 domain-containing protein, partial [Planctomycetota bacterium]|nr:DUF1549 domain-containing protein [Planctomycetota bacterium]
FTPTHQSSWAVENGITKSVKAKPIAKTLEVSQEIDKLIQGNLNEKKLQPNDRANDEIFLRRVYLDLIGRIPSYDETVSFLTDPSPHKRQLLIDTLLDSDGFTSHQFNFFADLLRIKSRMRPVTGQPYINYVKDSIQTNKPFDQFVRELIVADGDYAKRGHGAVGYYLRDYGMPEDNMSNTVRIFLGTRLECAQCHDHPFDVWTQKDYFEMVAFTGGIMMKIQPRFENPKEIKEMQRKGNLSEESRRNLRRLLTPLTYGVDGSGTGLARLPEDYQESDGEPNQIITAKTMFEKKELVVPVLPKVGKRKNSKSANKRNKTTIPGAHSVNSRQAYAEWLTSPNNPRFATVIANRLWKRVMGVGLIEPVDIITDETVPSHPQLMDFLTQQMVEMNFDLKQFLRAICNSQTYQRTACVSDAEEITQYTFRGPLLRRLSGEQLWDSLMTLAVEKIDSRKGSASLYQGADIHKLYEKTMGMDSQELLELANTPREELRKILSDDSANKMESKNRKDYQKYSDQIRKLQKKIAAARKSKDVDAL